MVPAVACHPDGYLLNTTPPFMDKADLLQDRDVGERITPDCPADSADVVLHLHHSGSEMVAVRGA